MKRTVIIVAAAALFSTAAYAGDNTGYTAELSAVNANDYGRADLNPLPRDPDLVRSGYYTRQPQTCPCTVEQINHALEWLGRPESEQIGHAHVLQ